MADILILGGYGNTGKPLARHLLDWSDAGVIIAGRNLDKAEALAVELNAEFPGSRASAMRVDASNPRSLDAAMASCSLVVVASPTTLHTETVAQAALDARVDYLDVQLSAQKLATLQSLQAEIERRGLCFITEAGFHPGLPAAMVRLAASRLDSLEAANVACYLNMGSDYPFTDAVDELMETFRDYQAQVYRDGAWTKTGSYAMRRFNFGEEIGERLCYSMFFEEMRPLPVLYPSLRETGVYMASMHPLLDWVITPLAMLMLKISPKRLLRPAGRMVWWGMQRLPGPPHQVLLKVDARGETGGSPADYSATVCHRDGYELTAIPVAAALLQVLDGSAHRPGLWMMGHLAEPVRLFADMLRMGVEFREAEPRRNYDV